MAALRRDDQEVVAVLHVDERRRAPPTALRTDVIEQEQRREPRHSSADPSSSGSIDGRVSPHERAEQEPEMVGDVQVIDAESLEPPSYARASSHQVGNRAGISCQVSLFLTTK